MGANRSSEERPEVLLVLILPVKPDLVNHLEEVSNFGVSLLLVAMTNNNLTAWCIMNNGSRKEEYASAAAIEDGKKGIAYHSTSTWVHGRKQGEQDFEDKNPTYHCSGIASVTEPNQTIPENTHPPMITWIAPWGP